MTLTSVVVGLNPVHDNTWDILETPVLYMTLAAEGHVETHCLHEHELYHKAL